MCCAWHGSSGCSFSGGSFGVRGYMQQKIQSACRDPQSGKAFDVGEFPDVETGALPVSHSADPAPQNDELQPGKDYCRIVGDSDQAACSCCRKTGIAAGCMILLVKIYRRWISPVLPSCCRFEPSCSRYALEAFRKRGFFAGFVLMTWRLMRCQPFCRGGYDPVPDKGFRRISSVNNQTTDET